MHIKGSSCKDLIGIPKVDVIIGQRCDHKPYSSIRGMFVRSNVTTSENIILLNSYISSGINKEKSISNTEYTNPLV